MKLKHPEHPPGTATAKIIEKKGVFGWGGVRLATGGEGWGRVGWEGWEGWEGR